jgi:hypothetical protein
VRDAGAESRQERRARPNRHLARRSSDLSGEILRLAAAIVVNAGAFLLWNLASRSPTRLARDLAAGASLLFPLAIQTRTFMVLETWTLLTGLLVEQLIGAGVRRAS